METRYTMYAKVAAVATPTTVWGAIILVRARVTAIANVRNLATKR